jgi:CheY-like chemotaxis protein
MKARTILLVHTGTHVREIFRAALEHAGYRVLDTWDGDDAVMLLAKHHFDAVVTDLYVESVDEPCLLKRVRADAQQGDVPVLVVTALSLPRYRAIASAAGATEFLPLPVLPREMVNAVHRHTGHAAMARAAP